MYNSEKYISRLAGTIKDLRYKNLEVIVVDDGSTDGSVAAIKEKLPQATIISQSNTGIVGALNNGLRYTTADWIARSDDDDVSEKDRLQIEADLITPETVLVCGAYKRVHEDGSLIEIRRPPLTDQQLRLALYFDNPIAHGSVLLRKAAITTLGGYRDVCPAEDYDFWTRLASIGTFQASHHIIYSHTENPAGISYTKHAEQLLIAKDIQDTYWHNNTPSVWNRKKINTEIQKIRDNSLPDELTSLYITQFVGDLTRLASKFVHYGKYREAALQALFVIFVLPKQGTWLLLSSLLHGLRR